MRQGSHGWVGQGKEGEVRYGMAFWAGFGKARFGQGWWGWAWQDLIEAVTEEFGNGLDLYVVTVIPTSVAVHLSQTCRQRSNNQ